MAPTTFYIKQGNTLPVITATLMDQYGNVPNLTGASVYFHMTNAFYGNAVNAPATIVNPTAGQVSYTWQTGDTNNTGTYSYEWYVVFASGAQETYPQGYWNTVQIDPSLTSGFTPMLVSTPLFNTIWSSTSAPTAIQGNNGDFWFDTATSYFYGPKANGTWPSGYLVNPAGAPLNSFGAPTGNVAMGGYSFSNLAYINAAPTSTSQAGLTVNAPLTTTVDVADFQINGVTYWSVSDIGSLVGKAQLSVAPTGTSVVPLVINSPSGTSVDVASFQINGTAAWEILSTGALSGHQPVTVAPTGTSAVPATFNTPSGSSANVANFQQNGTSVFSVNSSGNAALLNGKQMDLTAGAASPFIGNASVTSFASAWTGSLTNPAIGNGTLTCSYIKVGRMVVCWITTACGSTTTFGTGVYSWSLPFSANSNNGYMMGHWLGNFAGTLYTGQAYVPNPAVGSCLYIPTGGNSAAAVTTVAPATWAASTYFTLQLTYEATT